MVKSSASIVIPAYNAEKTITETINSVINQTISEWEIIAVDDCSTDGTYKILERKATEDDRIRLYRHDMNRGLSNTRNTGIKNARNDWLVFLDADDLLFPEYVETMFKELTAMSDIKCVHCGWYRLGINGEIDYYNRCYNEGKLFPEFARKNAFSTVAVCVVHKKIVELVNGFDDNFNRCADWDFWQKIARTGIYFKSIEKPLVYYRITENSLSSNIYLTTKEGLSIIENGHSYDVRIPFADQEFINGIHESQLSSAKLNWILWPCAYLIGKRKDPGAVFNLVSGCRDPNMDAKYIAGVFHDTVMAAEGRDSKSWMQYWDTFEKQIYDFLCQLENQSQSKELADKTYSILKKRIFRN